MKIKTAGKSGFTVVEIIFVLVIVAVLFGVLLPRYAKARAAARTHACINNMAQAQSAKESWALENKKKAADPVAWSDITPYIKYGVPVCPAGGAFALGAAGTNITCSVSGHSLPTNGFRKFP
ncbi:MAG: type II secretion system protein [Verrucomicrobiota bacterium]